MLCPSYCFYKNSENKEGLRVTVLMGWRWRTPHPSRKICWSVNNIPSSLRHPRLPPKKLFHDGTRPVHSIVRERSSCAIFRSSYAHPHPWRPAPGNSVSVGPPAALPANSRGLPSCGPRICSSVAMCFPNQIPQYHVSTILPPFANPAT